MKNQKLTPEQCDHLHKDYDEIFEISLKQQEEIERLNNIIKKLETDLYNMYITFGEFSEEYTENCIKKLKEGGDSENL